MSADLDREYQRLQVEARKRARLREEITVTVLMVVCLGALYLSLGVVVDALPIW